MLRIVPKRGDGVAIEISHHERGGRYAEGWRTADPSIEREQVHPAIVVSTLLRLIVVSLVRGSRLRGCKTERIGAAGAVGRVQIRVVGKQIEAHERLKMIAGVEWRLQRIDTLRRARRCCER